MAPFVDDHMINITRYWARLGFAPQVIVYWFRGNGFDAQLQQVEDTLHAIGHVYPQPRQWDHVAVGLVASLFRLGVTTRKIRDVMNMCGWDDVEDDEIIETLKSYESRRMAADPNFVWWDFSDSRFKKVRRSSRIFFADFWNFLG